MLASQTSWIGTPRSYDLEPTGSQGEHVKKLPLTPEHQGLEGEMGGLLKFTLLEHQRKTVKAMMDLEEVQSCRVIPPFKLRALGEGELLAETRAGVLSEKPGSGKTLEILTLVALKPQPPARMEISSLPLPRAEAAKGSKFLTRTGYEPLGFASEVRRSYRKLLPQTLVFVGKSVLLQWKETLANFTSLKALVIENIFLLREFYQLISNRTFLSLVEKGEKTPLSGFHLVLVKNGNISGQFEVPELEGTVLEGMKSKPIISVFSQICKEFCWARVVLDDFDHLNIPYTAEVIPALFTWFVSATKREVPAKRVPLLETSNRRTLRARPSYLGVWRNRELFTFFNIGCENSFIDRSTSATPVIYRAYGFRNSNAKYLELLRSMKSEESLKILEMLNGDAFQQAAELLGVSSGEVADIFEKLVVEKQKELFRSQRILKQLSEVRGLPSQKENRSLKPLDQKLLARLLRRTGSLSEIKRTLLGEPRENWLPLLEEVEEEFQGTLSRAQALLERVKKKLLLTAKEKIFEEKGFLVFKCCGEPAPLEASSCPGCGRKTSSSGVLFFSSQRGEEISGEEEILDPVGHFSLLLDAKGSSSSPVSERFRGKGTPLQKYSALLEIIRGEKVTGAILGGTEPLPGFYIPGILSGPTEKGEAPPEERKVLVFANFKETLRNIENRLLLEGIPFHRIRGQARDIKEIVESFTLPNQHEESISVLLVNGTRYCAGLNLQACTDLVFAHRVNDPQVETQIAGRAARYGRSYNLNVHYLLYENEYSELFPS